MGKQWQQSPGPHPEVGLHRDTGAVSETDRPTSSTSSSSHPAPAFERVLPGGKSLGSPLFASLFRTVTTCQCCFKNSDLLSQNKESIKIRLKSRRVSLREMNVFWKEGAQPCARAHKHLAAAL